MTLFNRDPIAPSFTKCNRTPTSREHEARELAQALAGCTVKPTVVPGFTGVAPRPARSNRVDPETRLKRKAYGLSDAVQREAVRDRAEQAKIIEIVDGLGVA